MKTITIFTPTYNRAYCLEKLYHSLTQQDSDDFIWLIVDDGSTDNTKELVESFIKEDKVAINYHWKQNGGKHTAHNLGVELCNTELFVCVDSDDYLKPFAVSVILNVHMKHKNEPLLGYYFRREYQDGKQMAKAYPDGVEKVGITELYHRYAYEGETVIVLRSECIKGYALPVFDNERFVTEVVFYNEINHIAPMLLCEDTIYVADYLQDGYTLNSKKLTISNPYGAAVCHLSEAYYNCGLINRIKHHSQYMALVKLFSLDKKKLRQYNKTPVIIKIFSGLFVKHYITLYKKIKSEDGGV